MSLKIAVCDDDVIICRQIKKLLEERNYDYIIDIYYSGEELIKSKKEHDIIFLDIEMEHINGLKAAQILRKKDREDYIIFLTSHTEYMPDAFKVRAFRFLNKPIQIRKFTEAITQAETDILGSEKIVVSSEGCKVLINQNDIVYIESLGDGSCIHTTKEELITGKTLKYWEEILDSSQFFIIHRTYLLGLRYVKKIDKLTVLLNVGNLSLPIARRKRTKFEENYIQYVKNFGRSI